MPVFEDAHLAAGLVLALTTAVAFNWSWVAQHSIASRLPRLTVRNPRRSLGILFSHRRWVVAFVVGIIGWVFYVVAVRIAPLSLVQATSAGGLALLAFFAQRASGERLPRREWFGVAVAVAGLLFLALSLIGGVAHSDRGSSAAVAAWLIVSLAGVGIAVGPLAPRLAPGAGFGLAAGLMYAAADVGTKAAVGGGRALVFVVPVFACHGLAFTLIQLAFQRGRALATAGISSFCTNALPIAGGILIFGEGVPHGLLGALRILAFGCVVVGAAALARRSEEPAPVAA
jgi:uncharacterized membrane protein